MLSTSSGQAPMLNTSRRTASCRRSIPSTSNRRHLSKLFAQPPISRPNAPWNLARISTRKKLEDQDPKDLTFPYNYDPSKLGNGVDIYVIDTGLFSVSPSFHPSISTSASAGIYIEHVRALSLTCSW